MPAKRDVLDPKAKAARQKKIAAVGAVLLVALLAYQVPKTLKMLHPKPIQHAQPTAAPATPATPTPAVPTPSGTAPATAQPAAATSLSSADALVVNADLSPAPLDGQLTSFTRFTSKDPFEQQGTSAGSSGSSSSSGSSGSSSKAKKPPVDANGGSTVPPSGSSSTPTAPAPAPQSAILSVNGVEEPVNVNSDFPAASPLFHLVALTATTAKIAIAGGSLASGAPTVTLHIGKALTLMNTADGTRYKVLLVSTSGSAAATTAPASTATPTTTTTTSSG